MKPESACGDKWTLDDLAPVMREKLPQYIDEEQANAKEDAGSPCRVVRIERSGMESEGTQGDDGDLRRTIEAERKADGAEAAIDVKLQIAALVPALDVLLAHFRENEGTDERQANLASMSVSTEHKGNRLACGLSKQVVSVVGSVTEKNDRLTGEIANGGRDRGFRIRLAFERVLKSGEPEAPASALDGQTGVVDDGDCVPRQRFADMLLANENVVIAETREAR
jgi:hypothetical protein